MNGHAPYICCGNWSPCFPPSNKCGGWWEAENLCCLLNLILYTDDKTWLKNFKFEDFRKFRACMIGRGQKTNKQQTLLNFSSPPDAETDKSYAPKKCCSRSTIHVVNKFFTCSQNCFEKKVIFIFNLSNGRWLMKI